MNEILVLVEETPAVVILVEPPAPIVVEVAENGTIVREGDQAFVSLVAAEPIVSHIPVAVVNGLAYVCDASKPEHADAFVGFSTNGSDAGQECLVRSMGVITLPGWGRTPGASYLVGDGGGMKTTRNALMKFSRIVAYAQTANSLLICHFSPILTL